MVAASTAQVRESNKIALYSIPLSGVALPIVSFYEGDRTYYAIRSMVDQKVYSVVFDIPFKKFVKCYANWVKGTHIQDAFPMLDADMREFVKTGITPEQWDKLFKEPDDNE